MDISKIFPDCGVELEEGDYMGEDGMIYCGRCHTRRQSHVVNRELGLDRKVPCLCKCRSQAAKEAEAQEKAERQRQRALELSRAAFSEEGLQKMTFEAAEGGGEALEKAKRYAAHFDEMRRGGKGLLLHGPVGTGKTYLAACIVNALTRQGVPCLMTSITRLAGTVQSRFDQRQDIMDDLKNYPLLVLDDLASERETDFVQEIAFEAIDTRSRAELPLIVTTNLTPGEIKGAVDPRRRRIFSRLMGMCLPVEVAGPDRRRAKLVRDHDQYGRILQGV